MGIKMKFDQERARAVFHRLDGAFQIFQRAHFNALPTKRICDCRERRPMKFCQAWIHFAIDELDMFSAVSGIIGNDNNQIKAKTHRRVKLINAAHHKATIA